MSTTVRLQFFLNDETAPYYQATNTHPEDRAEAMERTAHLRPVLDTEGLAQWWDGDALRTSSKITADNPDQQPQTIRSITTFEQN